MTRRALAVLLLAAPGAFAAGGHHAVDDATILEPGQCEVEAWATRTRDRASVLHLGPNCRVGPVEIGASVERERAGGQSAGAQALQVKGAWEVSPLLRVGASLAPFWRPEGMRGTTVLGIATLAFEPVALHVNAGRDWLRGAGAEPRAGAALEWTATPQWSAVAERYAEQRAHYARLGARWQPAAAWTFDASRSVALRGAGAASQWTLGATFAFERH